MEQRRMPYVGELVIARIEKVQQFNAHCRLIEYGDLDAFIPIREVSSGWIKNIHEFIHTGQIVVCKVIFIDNQKGTIDVSIKKVNSKDSKDKLNTYNLEKRLFALFQQAMKEAKVSPKEQKDEYNKYILATFNSFTRFIKDANDKAPSFDEAKLPKKLKETLARLIEASKKEGEHKVSYLLTLSVYNTQNGIGQIRQLLSDMEASHVEVDYIGAPRYRLTAEGPDYIAAEQYIQDATKLLKEKLKDGRFSIEKEKLKRKQIDIINRL